VTRQGETVNSLSKWYTGSEKPAKEIATASSIGEHSVLKPGQRVLIPNSYVKKTAPPPKRKPSPKSPPAPEKIDRAATDKAPEKSEQGVAALTDVGSVPIRAEEAGSPTKLSEAEPTILAEEIAVSSARPQEQPAVEKAVPNTEAAKPAVSFEELLLKEQSEVERLRREMQLDAQPAGVGS
jgi:hypothetical protein